MKVAQKIKHAKIHMQKFIQNPFPPLNPPINQTHKPRKIIKSTWNKQTQKFKINTTATWNHQTQSNLIRPSFHSHPLLFFLSRPFPKIKSLYLSLSLQTQSLFLFLSLSLSMVRPKFLIDPQMPPPNNISMMMNTRPGRIGGDSDESEMPSKNLWVSNLASDVVDSDLMDLFAQYGALDSVTSYSSCSYAFVFFKRIEVAKAAKDTLQGVDLYGHPIKSELDSEVGTGSGRAEAEEEESGSKIWRQEPGARVELVLGLVRWVGLGAELVPLGRVMGSGGIGGWVIGGGWSGVFEIVLRENEDERTSGEWESSLYPRG